MILDFLKSCIYYGHIYFLTLAAITIILLNPVSGLFSIILIFIYFKHDIHEHMSGYLDVALTVCKNE